MFKLIQSSSFGVIWLSKVNIQSKCLINKTLIRTKRTTFSRKPFKVLTDSGKDYFQETDYKIPISSSDHELKPKLLKKNERKGYNKFFEEGFAEDFDSEDESTNEDNFKHFVAENQSKISDDKTDHKLNTNIKENNNKYNKKKNKKEFEKVLKPNITGIPVYDRLGDNNTEFINDMSNLKMRKRREKLNSMVLEGKRLISDAIRANVKIKTIYFSKEENLLGIQDLEELAVIHGTKLKKVLYRDMKLFSDLTTSAGVIAICERPANKPFINNSQTFPLILIADNIRDPGNMGTMIRTAAAVGAMKLLLLKGCVDAWETKVVRSGAGAHFRIPIISDIEWPLIFNHLPIDKPLDIFIADSSDNLNSHNKEMKASNIPSHTINTIVSHLDETTNETILRDDSYDESNPELNKYRKALIASNNYTEINFFKSGADKPVVLVIGGESHGLSNQSYKLAYDYIGKKLRIPLASGVESLNSAVAAAIITYEIKRQFQNSNTDADQSQDVLLATNYESSS